MSSQIRYPSQYTPKDIQELHYDEKPHTNDKGGQGVYIRPEEGLKYSRMQFQSTKRKSEDKCISLYGISMPYKWDGKESSISNRLSLDLEIKDSALMAFLKELDKNNVKRAIENHELWFERNKKITKELVPAMYNSIVTPWTSKKPDAEGNYKSGTYFRVKVNRSGDRRTEIWVTKTDPVSGTQICEPGTYKDIVKGSRIVATVTVSGLYFMTGEWGCVMNCSALIVFPPEQRANGPRFVDDPDDDIPMVSASTTTPDVTPNEKGFGTTPQGWPSGGDDNNTSENPENSENHNHTFADGQ